MQAVIRLEDKEVVRKVRVFVCLPAAAHLLRELFCLVNGRDRLFPPGHFLVWGGVEGFVVGVVGQTLPFGVLAFYPAGL